MDDQPVAQLGFKPSALRRHDLAGIRNCHKLFNGSRIHRECDSRPTRLDPLLQFARAANAADEFDPGIRTRVVDAENGLQEAVLQHADVKSGNGIGDLLRRPTQAPPLALEVHADVRRLFRRGRSFFANRERGPDGLHELILAQAVQILHATVVRKDAQLGGGKQNRLEPVVLFVAGVSRVRRLALASHAGGGSRTVMAVRDIRHRDIPERSDPRRGVRNPPDRVLNPVGRSQVVKRLRLDRRGGERIDLRAVAIQEEHRARVRIRDGDVPGPVILGSLARLLVFLDQLALVVLDVAHRDQAGLRVALADKAVEIERRLGVLDERAVPLELAEHFARLLIDSV